MRAGDSDRDTAREILTEAYAQGRIDRQEYDQRIESTLQAHYLGQLVPVLNDISVTPLDQSPARSNLTEPARRSFWQRRSGAVKSAVFVVGITNLVWLWTSITSGHLTYYWPMWPALGMAIMLLAALVFPKDEEESESRDRNRRGDGPRELE